MAHEEHLKRIRVLENCDRPHVDLQGVNDDLHIDAKMTATLGTWKGSLGQTPIIIFNTSLIELIIT